MGASIIKKPKKLFAIAGSGTGGTGGGTIGGSIAANQIAYGIDINTIAGATKFIYSSSILTLGSSVSNANPTGTDPAHLFNIINDNSGTYTLRLATYGNTGNTGQNNIHWVRAQGTEAAPTPISNGDFFMSNGFRGCGVSGTISESAAAFQVLATENWSATANGIGFQWQTTTNGTVATSRHQSMFLNGAGQLMLGIQTIPYASGSQSLDIQSQGNDGKAAISVFNGSTGSSAYSVVNVVNNVGSALNLYTFGGGYTLNGILKPNSSAVYTDAAGGLSLGAVNASTTMRFYVGGISDTTKMWLTISSAGVFTYLDATTAVYGSTTGHKHGTATSQKQAFWNKTPIIQPTTGISPATYVSGGGAGLTRSDTFGGYTLEQLAAVIINVGLAA